MNLFTILTTDISSAVSFVQNIGAKVVAAEAEVKTILTDAEYAVYNGAEKLAQGVDAILSTAITVTEPDAELSAAITGFKALFDALTSLIETAAAQAPGGEANV